MTYAITTKRTANVTTVQAAFHNSIMAEMKAAAEGIPTHDVDYVIAYTGANINTITITDNSPSGDAGYDITLVGTCSYTGSRLDSIAWVFDNSEMNITMTEAFTYTDGKVTAIARTLS